MYLLYTLTAYPPSIGGAQIHTHLLAQHLASQHHAQVLCHWDHNRNDWLLGTTLRQPSQKNYKFDEVSVHRLGFTVKQKLLMLPRVLAYYPLMRWALPPIAQALEVHIAPFAQKADLVHNIRIGREVLSYASLLAARKVNIPFVLTPVHHPRWVGWRYQAYIKLYTKADAVIALTESEKKVLIELGVLPDRIHVTGIGPVLASVGNGERFRKQHGISGNMVLFLGQHYSYKGFQQLLEATHQVWTCCPDTHVVFLGPPVKNSEHVFKNYSDFRVQRLGAVDLQTKTDALAACDILCVPSTQESFGGVYTEAWSFSKPVIGCNIPAVADVITDGVDGYLVEQQAGPIADRIIDLLTHPKTAQSMGQAGKAKVEEHYTWPKLAEKTYKVYQTVCSGTA